MMMESCKDNDNMIDEFEMLLCEIPRVTSNYQCNNVLSGDDDHHGNGNGSGNGDGKFVMTSGYDVCDDNNYNKYRNGSSPVSGFSLRSDGSSGSLMSGGHDVSETGSITPPSIDELRSHLRYGNCGYSGEVGFSGLNSGMWCGSGNGDSVDELGLSRRMSKIHIGGDEDKSYGSNGIRALGQPDFGRRGTGVDEVASSGGLRNGLLGLNWVQPSTSRSVLRTHGEMQPAWFNSFQTCKANLIERPLAPSHPDIPFPQQNCQPLSVPCKNSMEWRNHYFNAASASRSMNSSFRRPPAANDLCYAQQNGITLNQGSGMFNRSNYPLGHQLMQRFAMVSAVGFGVQNCRARESLNTVIPRGNIEALTTDDSVIFQGECSNYKYIPKGQTKGYIHGIGLGKRLDRRHQVNRPPQIAGHVESGLSAGFCNLVPLKYNSLAEAQGYINSLAKDQQGCRFLQKMFDDGAPEDVQLILKEIVDHVVELTMNPFANYLIQKLLDVCSEEQKMEILLTVTEKPGELVKISLNSHGTRVVQKLIETLKVKQQILLLISALEPGFLDLIKDINGNHVIQHCLQYFSAEDNRFIFNAAAKDCVEIATHQHGCCVLQQCIGYSIGQYREELVTEISANGLLLAQDRYGNYVVQFVLDLKHPSATSNFIAQFEGNYVQLSTQKCSSHVVQRCLATFEAENCARVIHEFLSTACFAQLLQDPFANYVIKTALEVSQGPLKDVLVQAIEPHRAILCNSPYSKKICSLLWKK